MCPNCAKKIASLDKLILDKPARTRVTDYIEKAIEDSKKVGDEEAVGEKKASTSNDDQVHINHSAIKVVPANSFYSPMQPQSNKIKNKNSIQINSLT